MLTCAPQVRHVRVYRYADRVAADDVQASQSHIINQKAQRLDLRCVLLSDPSTVCVGGPNQNTSRIHIL